MSSYPAATDKTPLLQYQMDDEGTEEGAHKFRSQEPVRWWILNALAWSWAADYIVVFTPPAVELPMSSLMLAIVFIMAALGACAAPPLIRRFGTFPLLLAGNVATLALQGVLFMAVWGGWPALAVVALVLSGLVVGFHVAVMLCIVSRWFAQQQLLAAAAALQCVLAVAVFGVPVAMPPLVAVLGSAFAILVSAGFPLIAVGFAILAWVKVRQWSEDGSAPEWVVAHTATGEQVIEPRALLASDMWALGTVLLAATAVGALSTWHGTMMYPLAQMVDSFAPMGDVVAAVLVGMILLLSAPSFFGLKFARWVLYFLLAASSLMAPVLLYEDGPPLVALAELAFALVVLPDAFFTFAAFVPPNLTAVATAAWTAAVHAAVGVPLLLLAVIGSGAVSSAVLLTVGVAALETLFVVVLVLIGQLEGKAGQAGGPYQVL